MRPLALVALLLFLGGCELAYPTHEAPESDATVIPGPCKPLGLYCGNDKVIGDPNILYRCVADADPVVSQRCDAGCKVAPPGTDDYCIR
jgi:hypothetical protein